MALPSLVSRVLFHGVILFKFPPLEYHSSVTSSTIICKFLSLVLACVPRPVLILSLSEVLVKDVPIQVQLHYLRFLEAFLISIACLPWKCFGIISPLWCALLPCFLPLNLYILITVSFILRFTLPVVWWRPAFVPACVGYLPSPPVCSLFHFRLKSHLPATAAFQSSSF